MRQARCFAMFGSGCTDPMLATSLIILRANGRCVEWEERIRMTLRLNDCEETYEEVPGVEQQDQFLDH
jgi:hypothetical protein